METKICKKCGIEKDLCEFDIKNKVKNILNSRCKSCRRIYMRQFLEKNRIKIRERQKNYYWNNHEKELERIKKKHEKFKEKEKQYRKENRKKISDREKNRYHNDVLVKLRTNMRNRLKLFLKSKKIRKENTTLFIVGASPEIIKEYIEKQFIDGMTWENYGYYGWHIDHKIPLSSANTPEEIYKLCHYTNLQPLWSEENYKKSNKKI